ncbi:MAG: chemotaxis protein MotB, partial [Halothiobacillaceae bacterium]
MARKKKHEEHENHERWLVSYADFITLLFAFFVVMYAVSSVNEGKYRVLSDALLAAFRSPQKTLLPVQVGNPAKAPKSDLMESRQTPAVVMAQNLPIPDIKRRKTGAGGGADPLTEIATKIEQSLARLIDEDLIAVRHDDEFVEIEIKNKILFPKGGIELDETAKTVIKKLAAILRNFPNLVRVEGFTDNSPIDSPLYPSNWELSAARAATVVRMFAEFGVQPGQMAATGYSEYKPRVENTTPEGRNANRRVAVIVMNQADNTQTREELYLSS